MSMKDDARRDMGIYGELADECEHGRTSYCFDCVRKHHNQEMLDGKFDRNDSLDTPLGASQENRQSRMRDQEFPRRF